MKELGVYIHIPFCKKKCLYCDFYSVCENEEKQNKYFQILKQEIKDVCSNLENSIIKTIYIGGGTPSIVDSKHIVEILKLIPNIASNAEITIEVNPGTVTKQKLEDYINAGINRISIGMQATQDNILQTLGRIHNYKEFEECYMLARDVGFKNINIDCMIGLPNQSIKDVEETTQKLLELNPEHISMYSLIVEEGTPIEKQINNGTLKLPDEDLEREMYHYAKCKLEEAGFIQYEISNFAKQGYESKHNLDCWHQKEYIGFGAGAHSYTDGCRYSNVANIDEYINAYIGNRIEDSIQIHEKQDKTSMAKEFILLSLRTIEGCNKQEFYSKFSYDIEKGFKEEFEKLKKEGLITLDDEYIKLTEKGLDLANIVWQEFV